MDNLNKKKIYLTDLEQDLTYFGLVEHINEKRSNIEVALLDVTVYQYSSSNYLYNAPAISLLRPKSVIFIEEAN
jgi:hypothetical protein